MDAGISHLDESPLAGSCHHADTAAAARRWGHAIRSWNVPWTTGIYPLEMAFFLGACEAHGIDAIVESGRGEHAYSTQILGRFSDQTGIPVCSIDTISPDAKPFAAALREYRDLLLITGDAFAVLPSACGNMHRIALLIDGPKTFLANNLSYAATRLAHVRLIAHHNCHLSTPWGQQFAQLFPHAGHYEDFLSWPDLKAWEMRHVSGYQQLGTEDPVGRNLAQSSLAIGLPGTRQAPWVFRGPLKRHPYWLLLRWKWLHSAEKVPANSPAVARAA
ncbi:MAG: hypothetical protein AB7F89_18330 [Pirellulaceae bacterium]